MMSVRIILDNHRSPFQTGTRITGQVHVPIGSASLAAQESIAQVVVWWTCSSRLHFEKRVWTLSNAQMLKHFPSEAILFRHKYILTEREFLPAASRRGEDGGVLAFTFDIALPAFADPHLERRSPMGLSSTPVETNRWPLDDPWPGSLHSPSADRLPDSSESFFYTCSDTLKFGGTIDYILEAEMPESKTSAKTLWSKTSSATEKLTVVNPSTDVTRTEAYSWVSREHSAEIRSPRLAEQRSDRRLSLKERLTLAFDGGAQVPKIGLCMKFISRYALLLDSREDEHLPFRILVSWQPWADFPYKPGDYERITQQKIYLKRLSVSLVGHVAARTNPMLNMPYRPHSGDGHDERRLFEWKESSKSDLRQEIVPGTSFDVGPRLGATHGVLRSQSEKHSRMHKPMALVPSFRTLNIVRNYSLVWEIVLECAGVEVVWKYGEDKTGLPVVLLRNSSDLVMEHELPAYEERQSEGDS